MLFGTTETFAIEAISESELVAPSAVWGRMRIWCEGYSIGDFTEECCALYPAYLGFKNIAVMLPTLWDEEFYGLDDVDLCNKLDGLLYGYHGEMPLEDNRSLEECEYDWNVYGRFNFLTNWGEQFDRGGKSFIFCQPNGTVRILNRFYFSNCGSSRQAPLDSVLSAINGYLEWFKRETQRLT